jgi:hypothetical protein
MIIKNVAEARIRAKKIRIIEHRWRGCKIIMRGRFPGVIAEARRKLMIDEEPMHAIFIPITRPIPAESAGR